MVNYFYVSVDISRFHKFAVRIKKCLPEYNGRKCGKLRLTAKISCCFAWENVDTFFNSAYSVQGRRNK